MLKRVLVSPVSWVAVTLVIAGGLYWFQPWRLLTDTTVREALSVPAATSASPAPSGSAGPPSAEPAAVVVRSGSFVTHEHETTGTARLVRNPDGSHQIELVGLATSDGPDLRVWLTDQNVRDGSAGWRVFDDGEWAELGRLKGNRGDQVYPLPAGLDPDDFRSLSIWCKRFAVSFGAAALT